MSALIASLHYFGLALALGGVFMRGRSFRALKAASPSVRPEATKQVFFADNIWGISAILSIGSGLARAFGGFEKGTDYYLANPYFHLKMGLFLFVFALEIWPMVVLIRWRIRKKIPTDQDLSVLPKFIPINDLELVLLGAIVWIAPLMARYLPG